ncbi:MAG: hypothetical protein GXO89_15920 [Chlorobi bacterium]|nr:hypothetical protein [Chlorobiota bacterium]
MKSKIFSKTVLTLSVFLMTMTASLNAQSYDIFFWCSAEGSPMGMSGVDVSIDGTTVTSDFDGLSVLPGYAAGTYDYVASKAGYADVTGQVTVVDQNIQEFVVMSLAISIDLTVLLEGPYDVANHDMMTGLLDGGYIPNDQPYNQDPYYGGTPVWLYTGTKSKLQNDSDTISYSYTNEPYEDVWLGNIFENDNGITLTSVEI